MSYTVRPITDRTRFTGRHRHSPFQAGWSTTDELLHRELRAVNARNAVLELDFSEGQLRNDGRPRYNARATSPAAALTFETRHGALRYATDRFWTWQDNVRGIALGLEALRKIERYGIADDNQQYTGWKQLGAGRAMPASHMTTTAACEIFSRLSGVEVTPGESEQSLRARYRSARAASHPDRHDGDRVLWDQVEQAAIALGVAS